MTLCIAWKRSVGNIGDQLIIATDSLVTGGYRYPHATKLTVFNRMDLAMCWEGDTSFTYSFTENVRNDVDFSDHLATTNTDIHAVKKRALKIINQLWAANLRDPQSCFHDARLSFILGGSSHRLRQLHAWHIRQENDLSAFSIDDIDLKTPFYIGSGRDFAQSCLSQDPSLGPWELLVRAIEDSRCGSVGGVPQAVTIDRRGVEVIGVIKDKRRYLFGKRLGSCGHWTKARYVDYWGQDL